MADHLDAPGLMSPGNDARIDITDIYAFQKPGDPHKSILILNVNPLAPTLATSFDDEAIYEIKVDTDGDAIANIAFRVTFSKFENGVQAANVRRAQGHDAVGMNNAGKLIITGAPVSFGSSVTITESGPYKFYAGFRSDPFFFDLIGFLHGLHFTGSDFFIDKNVFSIVLEVPNWSLGSNPKIGVWARTLNATESGSDWEQHLVQNDQMGRPTINTVFNHGNDKNVFNSIQPSQMRALFAKSFIGTLEALGGYSQADATKITDILLPDILTFDYSSSAGYLNGRRLQDDVIDINLTLVTNGKITTDMVGPHTDYLNEFPYVGQPH